MGANSFISERAMPFLRKEAHHPHLRKAEKNSKMSKSSVPFL